MTFPSLSIVIPTHNTCELVLQCLASLAEGGVEPIEVVVVDDASQDGTVEAVRVAHPGIEVVETGRNLGFSGAANLGFERTSADLVLVLNSDTEVCRQSLVALVAAFDEDESLGVAGAELLNPDGTPQWRAGRWPSRAWLFAQASGLGAVASRLPGRRGAGASSTGSVDWVSGAAIAVRRAVWTSCGPFDDEYRFYCQDLDLCWSANQAGFGVAVVPGFYVLHHLGGTISSNAGSVGSFHPGSMWPDLVRFIGKNHGPTEARRAAFALKTGARLRLAGRALMQPFVSDRETWRRDTQAYRDGLAAL